MALLHRLLNSKAQTVSTTGFGTDHQMYGGRFIRKDGKPNVRITGLGIGEKLSLYTWFTQTSWSNFLAVVLSVFVCINLVFAGIYLFIGMEQIDGAAGATGFDHFLNAFFFSAQTFTTVGYGQMAPKGELANAIASMEALTGWLAFALAAGLIYGRFSRPRLHIRFSENAIIAPFRDSIALMLRVAPIKVEHSLIDVEAKVTMAFIVQDGNKTKNEFYTLSLEFSTISALTLNWTIVHPIDEESPLYKLSMEDIRKSFGEVIVFLKAFDEAFNTQVNARTSYTADEILPGRKFVPMYHKSNDGQKTILEMEKLNETIPFMLTNQEAMKL